MREETTDMIQLTCLAPCAWCCSQNEDSGNGKLLVRFARSNVEHGQSPTDYAAPPPGPRADFDPMPRPLCAQIALPVQNLFDWFVSRNSNFKNVLMVEPPWPALAGFNAEGWGRFRWDNHAYTILMTGSWFISGDRAFFKRCERSLP